MYVVADLCMIPIGVGPSLSEYVAACQRIIRNAGLPHHLHAYGTNIEGPWDDVLSTVKKCHVALHEMGAPRLVTTLRIGTRTDREQSIEEKIRSVADKLG